MKKKTILLDIDHTLFNTNKYLDHIFATLAKEVPEKTPDEVKERAEKIYIHMREVDVFHPKRFAKRFADDLGLDTQLLQNIEAELENQIFLSSCLYPDVQKTLEILSHLPEITLGIFSSGDNEFQLAKIQSLQTFFTPEDIHIYSLKDTQIHSILRQYDMSELFVVDDVSRVLHEVKIQDPSVITILMKREEKDEYADQATGFQADFTITTTTELLSMITA